METCCLCRAKGEGTEGQGAFLRPRTISGKKVFVHEYCALFSPKVYEDEAGNLVNVGSEIHRGNALVSGCVCVWWEADSRGLRWSALPAACCLLVSETSHRNMLRAFRPLAAPGGLPSPCPLYGSRACLTVLVCVSVYACVTLPAVCDLRPARRYHWLRRAGLREILPPPLRRQGRMPIRRPPPPLPQRRLVLPSARAHDSGE